MHSEEKRSRTEKHAVVLSGGGGFGAFEIGVLKTLFSGRSPATHGKQLSPEIFTGTSVGAYNAAILASKADLDMSAAVTHLEDLWVNRIAGDLGENGVMRIRGNPFPLFDPRNLLRNRFRPVVNVSADAAYLSLDTTKRLAHMVGSKESILHRTMAMFDLGSFISTGPLEHLIAETLSLAELRRSHRVLKIAATNWVSGQLRVFVHDPARKEIGWKERSEEGLTEETWPDAVMASTAIPGVFPPVKIDNVPYVDGGVVMNTPLRPAIDAGATDIHLISLNPDASAIPAVGEPPNTMDIFERLLSLAVSATVDDDIESVRFINRVIEGAPQKKNGKHYREITVHRYNPEIDLGGMVGMLDFRRDRVRRRIDIGELAGVYHDCEQEGCVIAGKPYANANYSRRKALER